jgi:hypothetical protein
MFMGATAKSRITLLVPHNEQESMLIVPIINLPIFGQHMILQDDNVKAINYPLGIRSEMLSGFTVYLTRNSIVKPTTATHSTTKK